jgi:hypothetical protein
MVSITYENKTLNRGTVSVSDFITERRYLKNMSPKTLLWYGDAFKAFNGALESEAAIKRRIVELRTRGISTIRQHLVALDQCLSELEPGWIKAPEGEGGAKDPCHARPEEMAPLISFKPKGINQTRTHVAAMLILDGGYRIIGLR